MPNNNYAFLLVYLKGAHVTLHARTEDDLDVDDILKRVAKSSGANYSIHKEKASAKFAAEPSGESRCHSPQRVKVSLCL